MVTKEELHGLLESLPESGLEEVRDLMVVLLEESEDPTEDEARELREGEAEVETRSLGAVGRRETRGCMSYGWPTSQNDVRPNW